MSIDTIIENFKKKYETENPLHYIRSMTYFNDVTLDSWNVIKMISESLSSEEVKNALIKEVKDYEKRMFRLCIICKNKFFFFIFFYSIVRKP
jgi:uncharacterized protein YeeX (DUF496 family)